jgi:hypothetical protein
LAVERCTGWRCGPSSATAGASPVPSRWCATLAWTRRWTPQDRRHAGGFLSRQGPQTLRWALYEAAKNSSHLRSPDHAYHGAVKKHHDGKIAAISVARKLARRCYHVLRDIPLDEVYAIPA